MLRRIGRTGNDGMVKVAATAAVMGHAAADGCATAAALVEKECLVHLLLVLLLVAEWFSVDPSSLLS